MAHSDNSNGSSIINLELNNISRDRSFKMRIPDLNSVLDGLLKKLQGERSSTKWYYQVSIDNSTAGPDRPTLELFNTTGNEPFISKLDRGSETLTFIAANGGMKNAIRRIAAALNNAMLDNSTEHVSGKSQKSTHQGRGTTIVVDPPSVPRSSVHSVRTTDNMDVAQAY